MPPVVPIIAIAPVAPRDWAVAKAEPAATFPIPACNPAANDPAAIPELVKPSEVAPAEIATPVAPIVPIIRAIFSSFFRSFIAFPMPLPERAALMARSLDDILNYIMRVLNFLIIYIVQKQETIIDSKVYAVLTIKKALKMKKLYMNNPHKRKFVIRKYAVMLNP